VFATQEAAQFGQGSEEFADRQQRTPFLTHAF
jgi:hypothetical protein